jgi:hypothetical protein
MGADFDRVLRGGSWFNVARSVRCASRFANDPGLRLENRGFRPVAEVKAATESDRVLRGGSRFRVVRSVRCANRYALFVALCEIARQWIYDLDISGSAVSE